MAKLFITYGGKKYEQKFRHGAACFVDQLGQVATGPTATALQEAVRTKKSPSTHASTTMDLTESSSLIRESVQLRYRALRKRQSGSTAISEAQRQEWRRDIHMQAGMSFSEAAIAARWRYERG
jgi:hypothetical protein